jgi:hypothetical protein
VFLHKSGSKAHNVSLYKFARYDLHCLDHVGNVETTFVYKIKLKICAKNGLIWRVTISHILEFHDVSLVLKKIQKSIIKREQ